MNTRNLAFLLFCLVSLPARAQVPPFFNGGGAVAFEPEISTVNTGAAITVAPTVSQDRKYVTIGGQFQNAQLLRLETFQVSQTRFGMPGVQGLVGDARSAAPSPKDVPNLNTSRPATLRVAREGALNRPGMTLVAKAD